MRPTNTFLPPMTALIALVLGAGVTHAADQLVFGKKLLLKNPPSGAAGNKVVHLGKDPNITLGAAGSAGDPQCTGASGGGTSSLRVAASGGAGDVTILLPCAGWTTNTANTLYKYKESTGASCKLVLVKNGVLVKAVCNGPQVAIDLNGSMSPVAVVTTLNSQAYCTEFGGLVVHDGSDDQAFLRKDAAAPGSCPSPPPPTTTSSVPGATTTSTTVPIACCQGTFKHPDFPVFYPWCNQGDAGSEYQSGCTNLLVKGTYHPGLQCDASSGTCGAVRTTASCCDVPNTQAFVCAETSNSNQDGCSAVNGTWAPQSTCDISTGGCVYTDPPETEAPCATDCGTCGSTCSGAGICAGGASCTHTGSSYGACVNVGTCTSASCGHDYDCPAGKVCFAGNSCCSRCP